MWTDYYLKFTSETEFEAVMPPFLRSDVGHGHATDVLGTLFRADTHAEIEGFHVNLRLAENAPLPQVLEPYVLPVPLMPKRVFA